MSKYVKTECQTFILDWYCGCSYHFGWILHAPNQPKVTIYNQMANSSPSDEWHATDWGFYSKTTLTIQQFESWLVSVSAERAPGKCLCPFEIGWQ